MRKQRILFIHGAGDQHKPLGSGKLVASLQQQLGSDYQVLASDMPDPDHPRYLAWRNQIEQELNKLDADALLIGHSLGGSMLLKHLAEGTYQRPIAGLFLVAVPYWGKQDWELEYAVLDDFASHLPPIPIFIQLVTFPTILLVGKLFGELAHQENGVIFARIM